MRYRWEGRWSGECERWGGVCREERGESSVGWEGAGAPPPPPPPTGAGTREPSLPPVEHPLKISSMVACDDEVEQDRKVEESDFLVWVDKCIFGTIRSRASKACQCI
jgi:hypothetical protein